MLKGLFGKKKAKSERKSGTKKVAKKVAEKIEKPEDKRPEKIEKKLIRKGFARSGDLIARVTPAKPGKSGRNIMGEEIPPREVYIPKLVPLKNVKVEKANEYYMATDGIVEVFKDDRETQYIQGTMYRHGRFKIAVSDDEMKAFLSVIPPIGGGDPVTVEDVMALCREKGITYGINEEKIRETLERSLNERMAITDVEIAMGEEPINGDDGKLEIKVRLASGTRYKLREDGSVDFKEHDLITSVAKDQLIAVVTRAESGKKDGYTVKGEVIKCREGKDVELKPGNNVRTEEENGKIMYYSNINGQLFLDRGVVSVEPQLTIEGDVGAKTGNIRFDGIVVVKGNVNDGFRVEGTKGVNVAGNVGKAVIKSEGDVIVQNGIVGKHRGYVFAKGNITAKFAENANIEAGGDVVIQRAALNCKIISGGMIISKKEKGQIIGGVLKATKGLEVKILGNESEHKMEIYAGIDYTLENTIRNVRKKIANYLDAIKRVNLLIEKLEKASAGNPGTLSERLKSVYIEAKRRKTVFGVALKKLKEREAELVPKLSEIHDAKVSVIESVYPGVRIYFGSVFYDVEERKDRVEFYYDRNLEKIKIRNI